MPYRCKYCGLTFCEEHRLPEKHNCIKLPERNWKTHREIATNKTKKEHALLRKKAIIAIVISIIILLIVYQLFL